MGVCGPKIVFYDQDELIDSSKINESKQKLVTLLLLISRHQNNLDVFMMVWQRMVHVNADISSYRIYQVAVTSSEKLSAKRHFWRTY